MKKIIYIAAFTFLGILLQQVVHAAIELIYIRLLLSNFPRYSFGLSWETWFQIHTVGTIIFLIGGIVFGYRAGTYFWPRLYTTEGKVKKKFLHWK